MVSVTWRLVTGVTETAGGGGAPWAAATPHDAATLSAEATTFQATELRPGIELLLTVGAMFACDAAAPRQPIPVQNRHPQTVPLPRRGVIPAGHVRHAGPIDVDLDVGPGMLRVFLRLEIALAQGRRPRRAHLILAALREARRPQDGKGKPESNSAIRLFPIVMASFLDAKSYQFIC